MILALADLDPGGRRHGRRRPTSAAVLHRAIGRRSMSCEGRAFYLSLFKFMPVFLLLYLLWASDDVLGRSTTSEGAEQPQVRDLELRWCSSRGYSGSRSSG